MKLVYGGEWVSGWAGLNNRPTTGTCCRCGKWTAAPGFVSIKTGKFVCWQCFDRWPAEQSQDELAAVLAK